MLHLTRVRWLSEMGIDPSNIFPEHAMEIQHTDPLYLLAGMGEVESSSINHDLHAGQHFDLQLGSRPLVEFVRLGCHHVRLVSEVKEGQGYNESAIEACERGATPNSWLRTCQLLIYGWIKAAPCQSGSPDSHAGLLPSAVSPPNSDVR